MSESPPESSAKGPQTGQDVGELQRLLGLAGFDPGASDGKLGRSTRNALRQFQKQFGLPADGVPGPQTWARLEEVTAQERPPSVAEKAAPAPVPRSVGILAVAADERTVERVASLLPDHVRRVAPRSADAVLVFISPGFIDNWRPDDPGVQDLVARAHAGEKPLIPIVVAPTDWSHTPFFEFQAAAGARPISELNDLRPVIHDILEALEGFRPPAEAAAARAYVTRVSADSTEGVDLLDRRSKVDFLASVLATKQLETPLAIGLFGDWGSGKSFFMRRLQERIVKLTEESARAEEGERVSYYCSYVRQVTFNAWLYSDSEIWPSFAAQVFRSVSGVETEAPQGETQARDLKTYQASVAGRLRDSAEERNKAATDAAALDARLDELNQEIADRRTRLTERGADSGAESAAAAGAARDAGDIVRGLRRIAPAWREMAGRDVALVVAPVAVAVAFAFLAVARPSWLAVASAVFFAVCGILAVLAKSVRQLDERTRLTNELQQLEQARDKLEHERDERAATTGRAESELDSELPLLPQFAEEQAARWLGREQLGVVTEIRLAFERLSHEITRSRQAHAAGEKDPTKHLPIDRVIVYVDDLDRCQHDVVIRVLETLKLLLSLPNFVVIVGVDSRWLFRSLEVHFQALLPDRDKATPDLAWAATPQNYLEKIFQYSLVLRPIGTTGFGRLIDQLLLPPVPTAHGDDGDQRPLEQAARPDDGTAQDPGSEPERPDHEAAGAAEIDLMPEDLVITPEEREFMKGLAPMFETPRAAKRLANVYRLLRVSVGTERMLRAEAYEPVLLLLSIGIGFPGLAGEVFQAIVREPGMKWPDFVRDLEPRKVARSRTLRNVAVGELEDADAAAWRKLASALGRVSPADVADRELRSFTVWIPTVAEFSFHPWQELLPAGTSA